MVSFNAAAARPKALEIVATIWRLSPASVLAVSLPSASIAGAAVKAGAAVLYTARPSASIARSTWGRQRRRNVKKAFPECELQSNLMI